MSEGSASIEDGELLTALREALRNDSLVVHYQPQVDARSGAVLGFEALLRWNDVHLGVVSPGRFIPVAEAGGLIDALGEWVLRRACRDSASLCAAFGAKLRMAVNLSPLQLQRGDLVEMVGAAVRDAGVAPSGLELELTEGVPIPRGSAVHARLEAMRVLGISVALDDFGTGYANLSCLVDFAVDALKVDGHFVQGPDRDPRVAAVLRAQLSLAGDLGLRVVAECVETEAQLARLLACLGDVVSHSPARAGFSCAVQGFYFSPALDRDTLCRTAPALQAGFREQAQRVTA
ncbi:MAG TPA: EAL domain-containing protein [Nevskiaceae bacterium]|nr:EAL domain-containing protein [Nevskiaceae bacterium]